MGAVLSGRSSLDETAAQSLLRFTNFDEPRYESMAESIHRSHRNAASGDAEARRRLQRLARILDNAVRLPGGYRVGLDGVIGLIPGIGDLAGAALSSYIVAEARRLAAPKTVLLRMILNVFIETSIGAIPIIGDLFDFAWKANYRNVRLLEEHLEEPHRARRQSGLVVLGYAVAVLAVAALAVVTVLWAIRLLLGLL